MKIEKVDKKKQIEEIAVRLFLEKGIEQTSVNDIVKEAKFAKGTFYIYYKDKSTLINEIIIEKNNAMLRDLMQESKSIAQQSKTPWVAVFSNSLIHYYRDNPAILRLISRSVQYHQSNQIIQEQPFCKFLLLDEFLESMRKDSEDIQTTRKRFLLLLEVIGVVCHNAIFYQQPDTIENIIPILNENIKLLYE